MRAARQRLAKARDFHSLESLAGALLPAEMLRELAALPGKRRRWLPLPLVFWACLNMVFHPGSPCREAQRSIQAWWKQRQRHWRNPCSSAFCAARARLPLEWLRRLWWRAAERLAETTPTLGGGHGRRVLVVDGTSLTAPDTCENQQEWPQPQSQKPGCGWPLIGMVGIFCLSSGALLRAAHGAWKNERSAPLCAAAPHPAPRRHRSRRPGLLELCQSGVFAAARCRHGRARSLRGSGSTGAKANAWAKASASSSGNGLPIKTPAAS